MRCFGEHKHDRICELCQETNGDTFDRCKVETKARYDLYVKLREIADNCKYRKDAYADRDFYFQCTKDKDDIWRGIDCTPKLECEKFCKKKKKMTSETSSVNKTNK